MTKVSVAFYGPCTYQIYAEADSLEEIASAILYMRTRLENPAGANLVNINLNVAPTPPKGP